MTMTTRKPVGTDAPPGGDLTESPALVAEARAEKPKRPTERTALRELERAQFAEIDRSLDD
jgi:hypothetical protein